MKYRSVTIPRFWELFDELPVSVQARAEKQFALFSKNPAHPSLRLKQVGALWSVRISQSYRALALREGDTFTWIWIGTHGDYDRMLD